MANISHGTRSLPEIVLSICIWSLLIHFNLPNHLWGGCYYYSYVCMYVCQRGIVNVNNAWKVFIHRAWDVEIIMAMLKARYYNAMLTGGFVPLIFLLFLAWPFWHLGSATHTRLEGRDFLQRAEKALVLKLKTSGCEVTQDINKPVELEPVFLPPGTRRVRRERGMQRSPKKWNTRSCSPFELDVQRVLGTRSQSRNGWYVCPTWSCRLFPEHWHVSKCALVWGQLEVKGILVLWRSLLAF